jgi:ATP phosphoribosyltransferase regulatory subunit HisZ
MPQTPEEESSNPLFRLFHERITRIASTEVEGFVDAKLSEAILEEETRKLYDIVRKTLPKRMAAALSELSPEDRKIREIVDLAFELVVDRFIQELESGKFHGRE